MESDASTGEPTYHLLPGVPGKSGGLEIAERLGLPDGILRSARRRRGGSGALVAGYVTSLHEATTAIEARLKDLDEERARLARDRERLLRDLAEREERQRHALGEEIELALKAMREEGDRYLARLKDRHLAMALRREESRAAARLRETARSLIRRAAGPAGGDRLGAPLAPGSEVVVAGLGVKGRLESVRGDRAVVTVRGKRMTVPAADCRPAGGAAAGPGLESALPARVRMQRRPEPEEIAPEIHLLGRSVEEALAIVDKYLDDATLAGLTPVRLVHGQGSGRLRRAIAGFLGNHPHVDTFQSAPDDQGGSGVTVVDLRL